MFAATFNNARIDQLEDIKWLFVGLYVICTIGVALGVRWEHERFPKSWRLIGHKLLFWSLIGDTLFTILIFATDGWISQIQKSEIGEALSRAANAETTLAAFRTPRKLTDAQKDRIARAIKPFPPVVFVAMTNPEPEPWDFVLDISATLKANGWDWRPFPIGGLQPIDGRPREGTTIADHIEIHAPTELRDVGKALADAIRDPGVIGMDDVRLISDDKITIMTVIVGSKK